MKHLILSAFATLFILGTNAQEIPVKYDFGDKYNDRYKYSNLVALSDDNQGGTVLVRAYYQGLILRPKGYLIEHYNKDLELANEFNYKLKGQEFVNGYLHNGQLYLLFLEYNEDRMSYEYIVHRSPIDNFRFTKEKILSVASEPVRNPLDRNYYNRNFNSGFTTSVLFNQNKSAFAISTHFKKGKINQHYIHLFNASLKKVMEHNFSDEVENKNFAFENIAISRDLSKVFIIGKAYFKKKRFSALERKFQYEMILLTPEGHRIQYFDTPDKYSESLTPILKDGDLICVGFYSNRRNNQYNGLAYFQMDPNTLEIQMRKYNPFSEQFMVDKYGKEDDKQVKNLVFKNVNFDANGDILFNAEEYFVTRSTVSNESGGRVLIERYHHNDIVSARLNSEGDIVWVRNINKTEVTQGDGAYASYSSYTKDGNTYFFICTAADNPQLLSRQRLIFKQGQSRNRNVFIIKLNAKGEISYEKMIDSKEARLPLMVSKPLKDPDSDALRFYAKRGNKKQLVNVRIN